MSDASLLAPVPIVWECRGAKFTLAPRSIDAELFFQSRHEAWAAKRLDARRGMLGEEGYRERLAAQSHAMDANRFAFGGALSLEWLTSREGLLEYALLLAQEGHRQAGGVPPTRELFDEVSRSRAAADAAAWDALTREIIRRDFRAEFPKLVAGWEAGEGASASAATATPTPSTAGSS